MKLHWGSDIASLMKKNLFLYCAHRVMLRKLNLVLGKNKAEIFKEFKGNSENCTNKIVKLKERIYDGNLTALSVFTLAK